jgi:hypothetical protein
MQDKDGNSIATSGLIPRLRIGWHVQGPDYDDRDYRVVRHIQIIWGDLVCGAVAVGCGTIGGISV